MKYRGIYRKSLVFGSTEIDRKLNVFSFEKWIENQVYLEIQK